MTRFVGVWTDPRTDDSTLRSRLSGTFANELPVMECDDALTLACSHPAAIGTVPLCLVAGQLDDVGALARELGVERSANVPEIVSALYRRSEREWLERLRGRFAVVLSDPQSGRAILAVDQLGSESLFFAGWHGSLAFASDLRDLLRLLPRRPAPDRVSAVQWLADGFVERGRTFFEGVRRLAGGHVVEIERTWEVRRYWQLRYRTPARATPEELIGGLRAAIEASVRRRLPNEDHAGVLLSAGLDSATVLGVAARSDPPVDVRAYSATFPDHPAMDESRLITALTDELGVPSRRLPARTGSALEHSLAFLMQFEVPCHSPNLMIWRPVLRRARSDGMAVLLDGEGGDELFGCDCFLLADRVRRGRLLSAFRLAAGVPTVGESRQLRFRAVRRWGVVGGLPHSVHTVARRMRDPRRYTPRWFTPDSARLHVESLDTWAWKTGAGPRWWAHQAYVLTTWRERLGAHDALRRAAELDGMETRHPFLDDLDTIEYVLGIPPELVFDPRFDRPLLREAIRGLVPDVVRLRTDKPSLIHAYLDSLARVDWHVVTRLLGSGALEVGAFVDVTAMRKAVLDHRERRRAGAWALQIWRLLALECWLRQERDRSFAQALLEELAGR